MLLGRVTGTVTATAKDASLVGGALLLVEVPAGEIIALDTVGAGKGDQVIVTTGSAARLPSGATGAPVDASIIAIVDSVSKA
ncbi:Ethanolamine utilization polyhedral-body-like protein EutN [Candidatus Rhodobacter oscarellae]|uniref:Ethanolamine utilization polyhedral-body-like protein EutN n=1 Tax=Candidatus Rhodobacter oscarellae TaxID=1675527 RepID=A0A0J9H0Q9_9RHOB|nr:EutN/CcmL family microcompartment protein [Candidatus Rhodobacter lobularis]KMW59323.1 Ethanolamine utilization polyhedral-body-like protein EutN [Candidatus Rhodobacter lobularis]